MRNDIIGEKNRFVLVNGIRKLVVKNDKRRRFNE